MATGRVQPSPLMGHDSLLQATVRRLDDGGCAPLLMTTQDHRSVMAGQMAAIGLPGPAIVVEPDGRHETALALIGVHNVAVMWYWF